MDCIDTKFLQAQLQIVKIHNALQKEKEYAVFSGELPKWLNSLSKNKKILFDGNDSTHIFLQEGVIARDGYGGWETLDSSFPYTHYILHLGEQDVVFVYNPKKGSFKCERNNTQEQEKLCKKLMKKTKE